MGIGLAYQGWVLSQKPRVHQSTSQIEIKEELSGMDGVINTKSEENFVGTQMTIIKSVRVMGDARASASPSSHPQYAGSAAPVPEIAVSMIPADADLRHHRHGP